MQMSGTWALQSKIGKKNFVEEIQSYHLMSSNIELQHYFRLIRSIKVLSGRYSTMQIHPIYANEQEMAVYILANSIPRMRIKLSRFPPFNFLPDHPIYAN